MFGPQPPKGAMVGRLPDFLSVRDIAGLPTRTVSILEDKYGTYYFCQLGVTKESALRAIPGIGDVSIALIKKGLAEHGMSFLPE